MAMIGTFISADLIVTTGATRYRSLPNAFTTSVSGGYGPTPGSIFVTTAGVDVSFTQLAALGGPCRLLNVDPTNYVTYGIWDGSSFYQLGELLPGECYVLRLSRLLGDGAGHKLRLKANTASCACIVEAFVPDPLPFVAFTPTALSGLVLWLKADAGAYHDAGVTLATDGQGVQQWNDQSGNGVNCTQATSANQLIFKAAIRNGLPILRGAGSSWMTFALQTLNDFSAFFVTSQTGDNGLAGNTGLSYPQLRVGQSGNHLTTFDDLFANTFSSTLGIAQGNWSVLEFVRSGSTVSFYQSGTAYGTGSMSDALPFNELMAIAAFVSPINGDLGEVLFYNRALGTTDRQAVELYLKNRWATP